MKSAKLLVALAATGLVATPAFAQKSQFEGFYGQLATGYENNSTSNGNLNTSDASSGFPPLTWSSSNQSFGGAPLVLGAGYNFSVAPKWLVGIGADYSFLPQTSSTFSSTNPIAGSNNAGATIAGATYKTSNRYNIFITPGYEIDKDKMAYLKVGYSAQTVQVTDQDGGNGTNSNVSGVVAGLGYKQIITGGLYGFGEFNYFNYSKLNQSTGTTSGSLSLNQGVNAYNLLVGVGYKF